MTTGKANRIWIVPFWITLAVTGLRFTLEKAGAPSGLVFAVGISWLPPLFGIYFALRLDDWKRLASTLTVYAFSARLPVVALMVAASYLHWGSHYDISRFTRINLSNGVWILPSNSFTQHLIIIYLPQLIAWTFYTVLTGLIAGGLTLLLRKSLAR